MHCQPFLCSQYVYPFFCPTKNYVNRVWVTLEPGTIFDVKNR